MDGELCVPIFRLCSYLFCVYTGTILSPCGRSREDLKVLFFSPDAPQEFKRRRLQDFLIVGVIIQWRSDEMKALIL